MTFKECVGLNGKIIRFKAGGRTKMAKISIYQKTVSGRRVRSVTFYYRRIYNANHRLTLNNAVSNESLEQLLGECKFLCECKPSSRVKFSH